jgi:hypothetical protein
MPNILINPNSGILEFNTGTTGSSSLDASLSGAIRMVFLNSGTLGIQGYSTGTVDRFFVEGVNGRLFEVDDVMTGSLMSVNDIAGLPILEVFSDDRVVMGQYNSNTLHVSGDFIGVDCLPVSGISLNVSGVSRFNTTGLVISGDSISASGKLTLSPTTTGRATFNIGHGTPPTSPVDGDIWTTTAGLFARINGVTVGPHGSSGTSGANGTSGTNGAAGTSGTSGTNGAAGEVGTSGTSGTNGAAGEVGTSGTSGTTGTSGTNGAAGAAGTSGTNGTSGTSGLSYFIVTGYAGTGLTLELNHAGDYIRTTAATAVTVTVPPTSSVNWVTDTEIMLEQAGAGQVTFATGTGVVINTSETLKTQKQYSVVALKNVSGDVWTLFGERELV